MTDRSIQEGWVAVVARHCISGIDYFKTIVLALQALVFTEARSAKGRTWCARVVLVVEASRAAYCSRAETIHKSLTGSACTLSSR
jgi:hypothetical protein